MDNFNMEEIYTEVLLENSRNKEYKKQIDGIKKDGINASCGDILEIMLELSEDKKKIKNISFNGHGCAISEASANIMCKLLINKEVEQAKKLILLFNQMIKGEEVNTEKLLELEDAYALKNISVMPARMKCALLAWNTVDKILDEEDK